MNFRKIEFEMSKGNGYGQYIITGTYRGKTIITHTNDSEAWDWQRSDVKKEHNYSRKHCYNKIKTAYYNSLPVSLT